MYLQMLAPIVVVAVVVVAAMVRAIFDGCESGL
jgi:hypothetical protein